MLPVPLNEARDWRIFSQGPVGSDVVVVASIGSQDSAQMRLTQYDEMVDALAPDRADQPVVKDQKGLKAAVNGTYHQPESPQV
jgi:hypothetical protein